MEFLPLLLPQVLVVLSHPHPHPHLQVLVVFLLPLQRLVEFPSHQDPPEP